MIEFEDRDLMGTVATVEERRLTVRRKILSKAVAALRVFDFG